MAGFRANANRRGVAVSQPGGDPSTWFVCLRVNDENALRVERLSRAARQVPKYLKLFAMLPIFASITAACLSCVRRGPGEYGTTNSRSRLICRPANCACKQLVTGAGIRVSRRCATGAARVIPTTKRITLARNFRLQNRPARLQPDPYGTASSANRLALDCRSAA